MSLTKLTDSQLVTSLEEACSHARHIDVRLILHLVEVEDRRLHLKEACASLFDFCIRRLHMSEGSAFRRINAARLVRRHPSLVRYLETGSLHLSALVLLRDHLTEANAEELFRAASHKSKREVEHLVATRSPKPDVRSTIRKLPVAKPVPPMVARLEPLAAARYKVQLTVSADLRTKLERAKELMRHRNPSGDLAVIVDHALDALLGILEKERLGGTNHPRRSARSGPGPARAAAPVGAEPAAVAVAATVEQSRVTAETRREVFARDGEQCTYVDTKNRRCASRDFLEIDHIEARAVGGSSDAGNLRVLCRAHNRLHAEEVFGQKYVESRIHFRQQKSKARAAAAGRSASLSAEPSTGSTGP